MVYWNYQLVKQHMRQTTVKQLKYFPHLVVFSFFVSLSQRSYLVFWTLKPEHNLTPKPTKLSSTYEKAQLKSMRALYRNWLASTAKKVTNLARSRSQLRYKCRQYISGQLVFALFNFLKDWKPKLTEVAPRQDTFTGRNGGEEFHYWNYFTLI